MELSISASATLIAAPPNVRVSTPPLTSLSSRNSLFFSNGCSFGSVSVRGRRKVGAVGRRGSRGLDCRCLFGLGVPELVVIAGVVALVFGPKKLPEVGRSIGKTVKSFQQAAKEFETELKKEPDGSVEPPPIEKPTGVSNDDETKQKELEASGTREGQDTS